MWRNKRTGNQKGISHRQRNEKAINMKSISILLLKEIKKLLMSFESDYENSCDMFHIWLRWVLCARGYELMCTDSVGVGNSADVYQPRPSGGDCAETETKWGDGSKACGWSLRWKGHRSCWSSSTKTPNGVWPSRVWSVSTLQCVPECI